MPKPKVIAILAMPNVQLLDVAGPLDVFAEANVQSRIEFYKLKVIASCSGTIRSSSGMQLVPDEVIGAASPDKIDTLLIAGAPNAPRKTPNPAIHDWLHKMVPTLRRYGSVFVRSG